MKVGFIQFSPLFGQKERNFEKVETLLKDTDADLFVLPELFNTGYLFLNREELNVMAEQKDDGPTSKFVRKLCEKKGCAIVYGFAEKDGTSIYNSAILMTPDGIEGLYRKTHLFYEEWFIFDRGNLPYQVFEYKNVRIGILICFDYIYPEATRTLALKGAQIVVLPSNLVLHYCPDAMVTRSIENRIFTILADRIGSDDRGVKKLSFIGKSQIVAPDGKILIRVNDEECVKVIEIDPKLACDKRVTPHNDIFKQRREDLYFR
ncbi:MAG: acyltransferase [candidate division WOR-3 bacterium]|nr:acyltransferase [candidate division WOR-3 bacterium]